MDSRLLIAQVLTVLVGLFPYIFRRSRIAYYFAGAHVSLALWTMNESIMYVPVSHAVKLALFRPTYLLPVMMVWYFFHFLLAMADIPVSRFPKSWRFTQLGGVLTLLLMFTPWLTANVNEYVHPFIETPGPAYPVFIVFMLWGLGMPLYQLGKAYKNTHGHKRTQLKYLFIGCCFAFLEGLVFLASLYISSITYYYFYLQVIYALLVAYAIFAHHLMDINVIIRKTLEYSLITVVLAGVYVGVITVGAFLIERWAGLSSSYSAALAAGAIALLFNPLRLSTQKWVDEKFSRQRADPSETLQTLSGQLANQATSQDVAKALIETLLEALQLKLIGLYLRTFDGRAFEGYRSAPESKLPARMTVDDPWVAAAILHAIQPNLLPASAKTMGVQALFPMRWSGGLMGFLLIGEKRSEEKLGDHERRLIESVLLQVSAAHEQILFYSGRAAGLTPGTLADVSRGFVHEIKTPLSNISLPAQATMMDLDALEKGTRSAEVLLPKFKDRMKFIIAQALKASERIDAIRDFAAVEDTRLEPVNLSVVLNESISSLEPLLEKTGVRVHYHPPEHPAMVRANPKQLEIVFVNLIKNAAEAMSDKIIAPQDRHLWLKIGQDDKFQVVEVKDSGPGISPENMERLFERYFTTKGTSGTGIGLSLVQQLLTALGGSITAASHPGQGAAFSVKLPAMENQQAKAVQA
jgi:signal transduction histidine kinase